VEPVPMTPMRWPAASKPASQRAECSRVPAKSPSPGMSGQRGWLSGPVLQTKWRAAKRVPPAVSMCQRDVASSNAARTMRSPKRRCGCRPSRSARARM